MARTKNIRNAILTGLLCAAVPVAPLPAQDSTSQEDQAAQDALAILNIHREFAIAGILDRLMPDERPSYTFIRNVRIVDPVAETVSEPRSVLVGNGEIRWIGAAEDEPEVDDAATVDGGGRYLAPGLTDMHIHSESASSWLLNLANGVTTVREMGGFPWMLATRQQINAGRLLGPNLYVAGPIFNRYPLGGYAVVPQTTIDARAMVRRQAACGYDFVKVHNVIPLPLLRAIGDEAQRAGLDLVGHVPHGVSVRDAAAAGLRTQEHLKGFLDDRTLRMGDTDYSAAELPDLWITPTLYTGQPFMLPDGMRAALQAPETRYVPPETLEIWRTDIDAPVTRLLEIQRESQQLRRNIVSSLVEHHARFLAGTDAANYDYQIMGFALIEEMRLLQEAGVPPAEALRAATSSPAEAMRADGEFGRIVRGARADLVLLDTNPVEDPRAYRANRGVMVRGIWLSRGVLDTALDALAALYADGPRNESADPAAIYSTVEQLMEDGFVFPQHVIDGVAAAFRHAGHAGIARQLDALAGRPADGPCADVLL